MFKKQREFVVEENTGMDVLKAINTHLRYLDGQVGNCGWGGEDESKWFISFYATDKKYANIIKDLKEIGEFRIDIRPGGQMDVCFERKGVLV